MARDGSGNYNLPAGNPVVTGTVISSTQFNSTMTDIATAMTQSISKDGQTTPTNNLPMGGNKHTGVADGNLGNQYASINQTQNGSLNKATAVANVVDAYTASLTPAIAAYTDGQVVTFVPSVTNTTTTVTLALNGLAAKPVNKEGGVACVAGDIVLNVPVYLLYYATGGYFLLLNPQKITGSRLTSPLLLSGSGEIARLTTTTARGGGNNYLDFQDPTGVKGYLGYVIGTDDYYINNALAGAVNIQTQNATRIAISSGGNVAINAPSSGPMVNIGSATQLGWYAQGSSSSALQLQSSGIWAFDNGAGNIQFEIETNLYQSSLGAYNYAKNGAALKYSQSLGGGHQFQYAASGTAGAAVTFSTALTIGLSGNVTIAAPLSGAAITATGPASNFAALFNGSATTGGSDGVIVNAGTNSGDSSVLVRNSTGSATYFHVRGDGVVFGNDGTNAFELGYKDTPINSQAGSYTLVAADRGKTIAVASGATITIPNSVFSAGATISFVIGSGISATLAQGAGVTLAWAGNGSTTGNRTITGAGLATVLFTSASSAFISGAGLS